MFKCLFLPVRARRQICLTKVERFRSSEILLQSNKTGLEQTYSKLSDSKLNMNVIVVSSNNLFTRLKSLR
jgi:hypothetical protein